MVGGGSVGIAHENAFESGGGGDSNQVGEVGFPQLIAPPPPSATNCRLPGTGRSVAARRVDDGKYASSSFASRYEDSCWKGALSVVAVAGKNESRSWASRYWGRSC